MAILGALMVQSCEDSPIEPNGGGYNNVDTTWVDDSLDYGGGGNDPIDSTDWNGSGEPIDSTDWNDNVNLEDSLGGN